jgi:hypothetical protein
MNQFRLIWRLAVHHIASAWNESTDESAGEDVGHSRLQLRLKPTLRRHTSGYRFGVN